VLEDGCLNYESPEDSIADISNDSVAQLTNNFGKSILSWRALDTL
jgi:hypothetical protein